MPRCNAKTLLLYPQKVGMSRDKSTCLGNISLPRIRSKKKNVLTFRAAGGQTGIPCNFCTRMILLSQLSIFGWSVGLNSFLWCCVLLLLLSAYTSYTGILYRSILHTNVSVVYIEIYLYGIYPKEILNSSNLLEVYDSRILTPIFHNGIICVKKSYMDCIFF